MVSIKGKRFIDVGVNQLIPFFGHTSIGKRVTVQFKEGYPNLSVKEISKEETSFYWGYSVKERANLFSLLNEWKGNIILTSRKGRTATKEQIAKYSKTDQPTLVVFGSPEKGIHEILGGKMKNVQNAKVIELFSQPSNPNSTIRRGITWNPSNN